jgi:hypothetical protein|nr:MAG TPA: hypothetical protein [Caudoviricetes sp.]
MKKILVATTVAGMLATTGFGFEEYYSFVNNLKESMNQRNDLYVGSIMDFNTGAVVGYAGCDQVGYFINLNVINSYKSYQKEVITLRHGFEEKDKLCDILNTASNAVVASSIADNEGNNHPFGSDGYNGGKNCVAQYLDVTSDKFGVTIPVTNIACYGVKPLNPLLEKPELDKYTGGKPSEYFNTNYNRILAWNDKNADGINALWLDKEVDTRYAYKTKEIVEAALKSETIGAGVNQDGVLLYSFGLSDNQPVIYIGDKTIPLTKDMLNRAPGVKAGYEAYRQEGAEVKYVMGCEDSVATEAGEEGIPTEYIYGVINGKKFIKYPVINNEAKTRSPYLCNANMVNKEYSKEQYELIRNAGLLLTKPVVLDDNEGKKVVASKPAVKGATNPKDKIVELLKSADMPGLKIDEKGRFLGEVIANGEGTIFITLPNDEELEVEIPANSTLNIIGKDAVASARDLQNTAYVYGCDIPLVEKPGKNTPEIGVIYVVYNGHAVASVPALVNGNFKCNKQMVNREVSQADYFNYYSLAMEKLQKKPAFK